MRVGIYLLGDEPARRETAELLKGVHAMLAEVSATALAIGRMNAHETEAFKLKRSVPEITSVEEGMQYLMEKTWPMLQEFLPQLGSGGVVPDLPISPTPEAMARFTEALHALPAVQDAERRTAVERAVTRNDNRVVAAALGSEQAVRGLGNTLRDGGHAHRFLEHHQAIDFFQTDRAQVNQIRTNPQHPLRQAGLGERCFTASNLLDAVTRVEQLASLSST